MRATLLAAVALCLSGIVAAAVAEEAGTNPSAGYSVFTTKCVVREQTLATNVVFDAKLDKVWLSKTLGSAFERAGLHRKGCDEAKLQESDNPEQLIAAVDGGPRTLTVIIYSGNMDDAELAEEGRGAGFCSEFDNPAPMITIDDAGRWTMMRTGRGALPLKHAPYSACYRSPQSFIDCPAPYQLSRVTVPSNYLVQVIDMRCAPEEGVHRVLFFGLGNFAGERPGDEADQETAIHGAAYLALEFELHRALVPLLP